MTDLSRRDAMAAAALASLAAAFPALAQTAGAAGDGAAWDLTEIYPDAAAWDAARKEALEAVKAFITAQGWRVLDVCDSPIAGGDGNLEYLLHARKGPLP